MGVYRILRKFDDSPGHLISDSEGIPMEWDTYEEAMELITKFGREGFVYSVVLPNGKINTPINIQTERQP
jgi:hypothetical protein